MFQFNSSDSSFKFLEEVLVRENCSSTWEVSLFAREEEIDEETVYITLNGAKWKECIPLKGNEHLLGTVHTSNSEFNFGDHVEVSDDNKSWCNAVYYKFYTETVRTHVVLIEDTGLLGYKYCRHAEW